MSSMIEHRKGNRKVQQSCQLSKKKLCVELFVSMKDLTSLLVFTYYLRVIANTANKSLFTICLNKALFGFSCSSVLFYLLLRSEASFLVSATLSLSNFYLFR